MQNNLSGRSFNMRVTFDAAGLPVLGWVHGFYAVEGGEGETITDIKRIPEAEHVDIAKALGIRSSSVHHSVNRALRRATDVLPEGAQAPTQAVSC
jgi:hypothetical protein